MVAIVTKCVPLDRYTICNRCERGAWSRNEAFMTTHRWDRASNGCDQGQRWQDPDTGWPHTTRNSNM